MPPPPTSDALAKSLHFKKDSIRAVVKESEVVLQNVRGKALYMIPFRLMSHLPRHDALIRPVDTLRVTFIGAGISTSGFRRHEPCCANDPIPKIGLRRNIIGGNHRQASTRDSGQVLVPTNRVSSKQVLKLMRILKVEDQVLIDSGLLSSHYSDIDQAYRCLEILAVTLQGLEPAPKPLTCLHQVQLIRTAARNDPVMKFETSKPSFYGGTTGLRARIFSGHPGTDDSSIHFLLNNKMGPRHKNKLLAGAKVLITTKNKFALPELGDKTSVLDVLIQWEAKGFMAPFLDTHLSYIGPMSADVLSVIMESTRVQISKGNYRVSPFNTSAFRRHIGSTSRSTKSKASFASKPTRKQVARSRKRKVVSDPDLDDVDASLEGKQKPSRRKISSRKIDFVTKRDSEKKSTSSDSSSTSTRNASSPASVPNPVATASVEKLAVTDASPAMASVPPSDLEGRPEGTQDTSREIPSPPFSEKEQRERLRVAEKNSEAKRLQKAPTEQNAENQRIASPVRHHSDSNELSTEMAALRTKFEEQLRAKDKELAETKKILAAEIDTKKEPDRAIIKAENQELRKKLREIETTSKYSRDPAEDERYKNLLSENESLKKQISSLQSLQVRRSGRVGIPSEKVLMAMSSEARRELRKRIDQIERQSKA